MKEISRHFRFKKCNSGSLAALLLGFLHAEAGGQTNRGERRKEKTFGGNEREREVEREEEESRDAQHSVLAAPSNYSYLRRASRNGYAPTPPRADLLLLPGIRREMPGAKRNRRAEARTGEKNRRREGALSSKGTAAWISYAGWEFRSQNPTTVAVGLSDCKFEDLGKRLDEGLTRKIDWRFSKRSKGALKLWKSDLWK